MQTQKQDPKAQAQKPMERNKSLRELLQDEFKDLFPYVPLTGAEYAAYLSAIKKWLEQKFQTMKSTPSWLEQEGRIDMLKKLLEELE